MRDRPKPEEPLCPCCGYDREPICPHCGHPFGEAKAALFTEPAWLTAARAWLADFRREVEAAGLEWVAPSVDHGDELSVDWMGPGVHVGLSVDDRPGGWDLRLNSRLSSSRPFIARHDDLAACVELYRRWLAAREGGKP